VIFSATGALAILAQSNPNAAMAGCTVFSALAAYVALFHTAPLLIYNFAVTMVIAAIEAVRVAHQLNVFTAVSSFAVVVLTNVMVPFCIQTVGYMLGVDAVLGERDELTALLTRRAFHSRAEMRLKQGLDRGGYFVATVIDLDRFKQLNDNHGHRTGDDALASVARALTDTTDDTAVICRSGGEEFVIADIFDPDEVSGKAQQLCDVIAALPFGITASIGTAGFHPARWDGESGDLLTELIAAADDAMYVAKRRGGNQTYHHNWPLPPALNSVTEDDAASYGSEGLTA
jgi:diguanylate cyclase (GGDEF)-like protein